MDPAATIVVPTTHAAFVHDAALARHWFGREQTDQALLAVCSGVHPNLAAALQGQGVASPEQAAALAALPPVRLIGPYEVVRQLGAGAMGEVALARQLGSEREVALKTVRTAHADDVGFVRRFLREAELAARLDHPNVVGALAYGELHGIVFLALEYVRGPVLTDLLKASGALLETDALRLVRGVAEGLAHAWETAALVHRDVKPGNIILARAEGDPTALALLPEDVPKLIDFGLAKAMQGGGEGASMTLTGQILGTPQYMSPEQIQQDPGLDHRADQYSLGATLFHLLTGRPPYAGSTPIAIITSHLHDPVADPGTLLPALSPETRRLVMTALAKDRNTRYPDHRAFAAACDRALAAAASRPAVRPAPRATATRTPSSSGIRSGSGSGATRPAVATSQPQAMIAPPASPLEPRSPGPPIPVPAPGASRARYGTTTEHRRLPPPILPPRVTAQERIEDEAVSQGHFRRQVLAICLVVVLAAVAVLLLQLHWNGG